MFGDATERSTLGGGVGAEEEGIDIAGYLGGSVNECTAGWGQGQSQRAGIGFMGVTDQQASLFQGAHHLRGHHPVGAGLCGDLLLGWWATHMVEPAYRGQQHELGVGQAQRAQPDVQFGSPGQCRVVQPESRGQQRTGLPRTGLPRIHDPAEAARRPASRSSAAQVANMSRRMRGPK